MRNKNKTRSSIAQLSSSKKVSKMIGYFLAALQLLFIALKILDKIDWSWWAVFTPAYIWLAVVMFFGCSSGRLRSRLACRSSV